MVKRQPLIYKGVQYHCNVPFMFCLTVEVSPMAGFFVEKRNLDDQQYIFVFLKMVSSS